MLVAPRCLLWLLAALGTGVWSQPALAQTRILKCVAPDGSVSYLDAPACPGAAQGEEQTLREHKVTLTTEESRRARGVSPSKRPTPEEVAERIRQSVLAAEGAAPDSKPKPRPQRQQVSYRCSAAGGIWYRHSPCPAVIGQVGVTWRDNYGQSHSGTTSGVAVKQEVVTRSEACKAINSRASRPGRQLDEVPSSYEKLKGKDLC